jgi:hypothetical protein
LRGILRGNDPQIEAFKQLVIEAKPDVIALQGVDYDLRHATLEALIQDLAANGLVYPHSFANPPNAGQTSSMDMNGNGRLGEADDAHGFGHFNGMGGMAVLSRFPIQHEAVEDYTQMLWRDLKGHLYPTQNGIVFGGPAVFDTHRLSSKGHWVVPIQTPAFGTLRLMTFHATPPVFDGPEDRNGRRNHDEVAFWLDYLKRDQSLLPFILAGTANTDPMRGDGRPEAITALLSHPKIQNPFDDSPTADFAEPTPGDLRVDYLLPSAEWQVLDHGLISMPLASRHSLLWIDIAPR